MTQPLPAFHSKDRDVCAAWRSFGVQLGQIMDTDSVRKGAWSGPDEHAVHYRPAAGRVMRGAHAEFTSRFRHR